MVFAHLPAGYLLAWQREKLMSKNWSKWKKKQLGWMTMLGSILPDIDLLPFMNDQVMMVNHRTLFSHTPFFYLVVTVGVWLFGLLEDNRFAGEVKDWWTALVSGILLHLALDTYLVGIKWWYPFNSRLYGLFAPNFGLVGLWDWVVKYGLSPYILLEVGIIAVAVGVWVKYGYLRK